MRNWIGGLLYALALLLLAWAVAMAFPRPITRTLQVGDASVTLTADRQWVLFPGQCLEVRWTLQNVHAATFYPKVEPGIQGGAGVRSVFFSEDYKPGLTITEDAPGGVPLTIDDPAQTVTGSGVGCIDYTIEPKLRAFFADGSSRSLKLGLDVFFLRMEVWLLIFGAGAAFFAASWLMRWPSSERVTRLSVWLSAALLTLYALLFAQHPRFLSMYWLDVVPFAALVSGAWGLSLISVARRDAFDRLASRARASAWLVPSVFIVWLWLLAFGYYQPNTGVISELLWLPLYLWAFVAGMAILWVKRPREQSAPLLSSRSRRVRLIIALTFAALSFARDWVVFEPLTALVHPDSWSYVVPSRDFMVRGASEGLPDRIFPYVLMAHLTRAWEDPVPLTVLQAVLGALSVGTLVYVLSRYRLWLGVGVGLLLTANLAWATYNRAIVTEGPFISFNLLSLAVLVWHMQRGAAVRRWELVTAGVLYAWTFLFRGTGLVLIVPVLLVYGVAWRRWRKPLWVLAGFAAFLLGVAGFNQWRYNAFGLISPEYGYGTAEAGLFAYHLFSPDNGEASARIDAALRTCMGYLDYDDVQRHSIVFLTHFHPCLNARWDRATIHSRAFAAIAEIVRHRTFDFARLLVREWGVSFTLSISDEFDAQRNTKNMLDHALRHRHLSYPVPKALWPTRTVTALEEALQTIDNVSFYPLQPYLAVDLISRRSAIVMLAAFAMFSGATWVFSRYRGLITLALGSILYQVVTTTALYPAYPRYLLILLPFTAIITVLAAGALANGLRRARVQVNLWMLILTVFALVYVTFANPTLRQALTAPLSASLGVNLLEKYGVDALDFAAYQALRARGAVALYPAPPPGIYPDSRYSNGVPELPNVFTEAALTAGQRQHLQGWYQTGLPGYLHDVGVAYVLFDEQQWTRLSNTAQAMLNDPTHYQLVGEWTQGQSVRRLYHVVGDARGVYEMYVAGGVALFGQPDNALHLYRVNADNQGVFEMRIEPQQIRDGQREFVGDSGIVVRLTPPPTEADAYVFAVYDAAGTLLDDGYVLRLP